MAATAVKVEARKAEGGGKKAYHNAIRTSHANADIALPSAWGWVRGLLALDYLRKNLFLRIKTSRGRRYA